MNNSSQKQEERAVVPGLTDQEQKPPSLLDYVDHHYSEYPYKRSYYLDLLFELEEKYPQFSYFIFNTGMPVFVEDPKLCPTAAVSFNLITKQVRYFWNTTFFDSLTPEEIKFVMVHETLHLYLSHPLWARHMQFQKIWNVACDVVINDLIAKDFSDVVIPSWVYRGMTAVGHDCAETTAEKVYDEILSKAQIFTVSIPGDGDKNGKGQDGDGKGKNGKGQDGNNPGTIIDIDDIIDGDGEGYEIKFNGDFKDADDHSGWTDIPADRLEQVAKEIKKVFSSDNEEKNRGTEASDAGRLVYKKKNEFSLRQYIKNIVARRVDEEFTENWRRFNPKMATIYPDVILPYSLLSETRATVELLFMIDVSGSVPDYLVGEFVAIAKNHSRDHDVRTCSFDVNVQEFDIRTVTSGDAGKQMIPGGGGTSFENVVEWVIKENPDYDVVFVLTDGWGGSIDASKIETRKWFWIISPNGDTVSESYGKSVKIPPEYIKKREGESEW